MRDPYQVLGLSRGASAEDVKRAYRRLAKTHHPDAPGAGPQSRARFQEINEAYHFLTKNGTTASRRDPAAREKAYARQAAEAETITPEPPKPEPKPKPQPKSNPQEPKQDARPKPESKPAPKPDPVKAKEAEDEKPEKSDFFETLKRPFRRKGEDTSCTLTVPFLDAIRGGTHRVTMPNGRVLDVRLPEGIADGRQIRLRGQGEPGMAGGEAGDALVTIKVAPHPYFSREDDDIRLALPVSLREAVEGAQVKVPTVDGSVTMSVPAGSNTGRVLRLAGKGLKKADGTRGHQFVELIVVLPEKPDPALAAFVRNWEAGKSQNPRADFGLD